MTIIVLAWALIRAEKLPDIHDDCWNGRAEKFFSSGPAEVQKVLAEDRQLRPTVMHGFFVTAMLNLAVKVDKHKGFTNPLHQVVWDKLRGVEATSPTSS